MKLTRRQREVFDIIEQLIVQNHHSPTLREIADAAGLAAVSGVANHLAKLQEAGLITRDQNAWRGIRIVGKCPVCGRADAETEYKDVPLLSDGSVKIRYVDGGKLRPGKVDAE